MNTLQRVQVGAVALFALAVLSVVAMRLAPQVLGGGHSLGPERPSTHTLTPTPSHTPSTTVVPSPTVSAPPTPTRSPGAVTAQPTQPIAVVVHNAGLIGMRADSMTDIDVGPEINENYDIQVPASGAELVVRNNARMLRLSGPKREMIRQSCVDADLYQGVVAVADLPVGAQLCVQTSAGRPAMLEIMPSEPAEHVIAYSFVVWERT